MAPVTRSHGAASDTESDSEQTQVAAGSSNVATALASAPVTDQFDSFLNQLRTEAEFLGYAAGTAEYARYVGAQLSQEKERKHQLEMARIQHARIAPQPATEGPAAAAR